MKPNPPTTYSDCLKSMFGLRRFGIKLGLSTIQQILSGLGNPQYRYASIHVAGTNGKGSVASFLASILKASGYKVGLYTSPHLVRFNERICVNNQQISDENVVSAYRAVTDVHGGDREPTFFEYTTAMALFEFGRQAVDWAVVETGMGGRLDATNVLQPVISIITNVSLEHQAYLGKTLAEITGEKGGIIKRNTPVVTAVSQPSAISVLENLAAELSAPLFRLKKDFRVRRKAGHTFSYYGLDHVWRGITTSLTGNHQVENAALVLAACEILNRNNTTISLKHIQAGLNNTRWPGRLEVVSDHPMIILDGAHNLNASKELAKYLKTELKGRRITLVIGILEDKPYEAIFEHLLPACSRVILTRPKIGRALPVDTLYPIAAALMADVQKIPDVSRAIAFAV
ncbi:MAG: bifunctional folylpolyglutamate synthase/dihydrofolate synthase, partial [Deltaproteobacteria bacterium]|nr:bifunctional folylpolyglutamate synthase/dihydrofolate synthase [Deltaproteobacteria bacterium]